MKKVIIFIICGILIFLFGFFAGGYWTALKLAGVSIYKMNTSEVRPSRMSPVNTFWESIFFGAKWENTNNMKPIPDGKGYLTGKFVYQGKSAGSIKFKLFLNSEFRTSPIITDDNGSFEIRLPVGTWYVNMIQCEGWTNKPDGNFILLSGDEARIDKSSPQDLFFHRNEKGKEVVVGNKKPEKEHIVLTINPRIKVIWPRVAVENQQATIAHSVIQWENYPTAVVYVLRIDKVTRESKTSTIYSPVLYRKVSGLNSLSLKTLPNAKGSEVEEYAVTIKAYNQAGILVSESPSLSATFALTDGRILFSEEH